jgi:transposase
VSSDSKWARIKDFLPGKAGDRGVAAKANRRFIEAVSWVARTGSPWRDLPEASGGHWHRAYVRHSRWGKGGMWAKLLSSVGCARPGILGGGRRHCPAHQHGAAKKRARTRGKVQGRGSSTKTHAAIGALGNPVRLLRQAGKNGVQSFVKMRRNGGQMQRLPKGLYSPKFRDEAVRLHLKDNLTITEISSRLSMPKGTLKN